MKKVSKKSAFLVMVVDKSGSMASMYDGAIKGFNKFIQDQREIGTAKDLATVCLFDTNYELLVDCESLENVQLLNKHNYKPNGGTALNDTLYETIDRVGQQVVSMKAKDRPSKVIVCVISDGEENSSRRYTDAQVKSLIEHRKELFNWEFVFIGANQDVMKTARTYSFNTESTFTFSATSKGLMDGYDTISSYVTSIR